VQALNAPQTFNQTEADIIHELPYQKPVDIWAHMTSINLPLTTLCAPSCHGSLLMTPEEETRVPPSASLLNGTPASPKHQTLLNISTLNNIVLRMAIKELAGPLGTILTN
jgi:hypothetical protein